MEDLTYEQTVELAENVKFKKEADEIYANFLNNIKLDPSKYKGNGRFIIWSDTYNSMSVVLNEDKFVFKCDFLHEDYSMNINPSAIFSALKKNQRVVDHFKSAVRPK